MPSLHGVIYLLINRCAAHMKTKMIISAHGSFDGLCLVHAKLLEYVMSILCLANEDSIFDILDLKSKKICGNPIMNILNLSVMILLNSSKIIC
jgi:hypothetical protein